MDQMWRPILVDPQAALTEFKAYDFSKCPDDATALQAAIGHTMASRFVSVCTGLEVAQMNTVVRGDSQLTHNEQDDGVIVHTEVTAMFPRGAIHHWIAGIVTVEYTADTGERRIDSVHLTAAERLMHDDFRAYAVGPSLGLYTQRHFDMLNGRHCASFERDGMYEVGDSRAVKVMAIATRVLGACGVDKTATIEYSKPQNIAVRTPYFPAVPLTNFLYPTMY